MKYGPQLVLGDDFGIETNDCLDHYVGMPEYNNINQPDAVITAKFKFRSKDDYDYFHKVVKKHLYGGGKVFDGMQREDKKQAWFPLGDRPSRFVYVDEE
jgi:hypothetical protein